MGRRRPVPPRCPPPRSDAAVPAHQMARRFDPATRLAAAPSAAGTIPAPPVPPVLLAGLGGRCRRTPLGSAQPARQPNGHAAPVPGSVSAPARPSRGNQVHAAKSSLSRCCQNWAQPKKSGAKASPSGSAAAEQRFGQILHGNSTWPAGTSGDTKQKSSVSTRRSTPNPWVYLRNQALVF